MNGTAAKKPHLDNSRGLPVKLLACMNSNASTRWWRGINIGKTKLPPLSIQKRGLWWDLATPEMCNYSLKQTSLFSVRIFHAKMGKKCILRNRKYEHESQEWQGGSVCDMGQSSVLRSSKNHLYTLTSLHLYFWLPIHFNVLNCTSTVTLEYQYLNFVRVTCSVSA